MSDNQDGSNGSMPPLAIGDDDARAKIARLTTIIGEWIWSVESSPIPVAVAVAAIIRDSAAFYLREFENYNSTMPSLSNLNHLLDQQPSWVRTKVASALLRYGRTKSESGTKPPADEVQNFILTEPSVDTTVSGSSTARTSSELGRARSSTERPSEIGQTGVSPASSLTPTSNETVPGRDGDDASKGEGSIRDRLSKWWSSDQTAAAGGGLLDGTQDPTTSDSAERPSQQEVSVTSGIPTATSAEATASATERIADTSDPVQPSSATGGNSQSTSLDASTSSPTEHIAVNSDPTQPTPAAAGILTVPASPTEHIADVLDPVQPSTAEGLDLTGPLAAEAKEGLDNCECAEWLCIVL